LNESLIESSDEDNDGLNKKDSKALMEASSDSETEDSKDKGSNSSSSAAV
tara:strand:+ start:94 stop:243 length:150 start_codon:yes stop_codon:yes gene_type:complete